MIYVLESDVNVSVIISNYVGATHLNRRNLSPLFLFSRDGKLL